ncbi:hypothetical protein UVI_02014730 [Ustilaginoidea virens]|uniref:C6 transcription factor n=1 Tax=Ustilaginoidea virens TaxID=1159556 RepID=A0A1B5L8L4_USTVR|nr:hypothetical protein UVI_02014730 [Ustilaginoidea virens]
MDAWKHESQFGDFIAESSTFPTAPPSPAPDHRPTQPRDEDIQAFQRTLEQVQKVESHLKHHKEETTQVQHLVGFLKGSRKISPTLSIAQQYERLQPLRTWLFWMPVGYLQNFHGSANSLVVIAHLYTVALLMERLFPEIGAAYFGSLSISPIEEIARRLMSISLAGGSEGGLRRETPLTLMEYPINAVGDFRSRMGWVHPERTRSFPQFHPPNFPVHQGNNGSGSGRSNGGGNGNGNGSNASMTPVSSSAFLPFGSPAFGYSAEGMPMLNSAAIPGSHSHSGSPSMLSSSFSNPQYLSVPSPSYTGAYSPTSSTFEGSATYSDTEEYASYDLQGSPPAYLATGQPSVYHEAHSSYGLGFVTPHQPVWI